MYIGCPERCSITGKSHATGIGSSRVKSCLVHFFVGPSVARSGVQSPATDFLHHLLRSPSPLFLLDETCSGTIRCLCSRFHFPRCRRPPAWSDVGSWQGGRLSVASLSLAPLFHLCRTNLALTLGGSEFFVCLHALLDSLTTYSVYSIVTLNVTTSKTQGGIFLFCFYHLDWKCLCVLLYVILKTCFTE